MREYLSTALAILPQLTQLTSSAATAATSSSVITSPSPSLPYSSTNSRFHNRIAFNHNRSAYLTPLGAVTTKRLLAAPEILTRNDFVSLVFASDAVLLLLTVRGEVYTHTGELIRKHVTHFATTNALDESTAVFLCSRDGSFTSYPKAPKLLPLPLGATVFARGFGDYAAYLLDDRAMVRLYMHNAAWRLPPTVKLVGVEAAHGIPIYETMMAEEYKYTRCYIDNMSNCFYFADDTGRLTVVSRLLKGRYLTFAPIVTHHQFPAAVKTLYTHFEFRGGAVSSWYVVLLTNGNIYFERYNRTLAYHGYPIVAIGINDDHLSYQFADGDIRQCCLHEKRLVVMESSS